MNAFTHRNLTSDLADDLGWLERHCRSQPALAVHAGRLRLAAALARNCIGPYLEAQPPVPLHLAVVGGAGTGKSTVVNLLSGSAAAEANPQAGFTRHPIAYAGGTGALGWPSYLGFLGPLQRLGHPAPANLDEDVYQVRRVVTGEDTPRDFVIWDCPDMTTWAATGYVPRLLEVAGLADVVVYVASDERYNDEVPTQFLQLLLEANKPVVVCLTKMRPEQATPLLDHFRQEVLRPLKAAQTPCVAVPFLTPAELTDLSGRAREYRQPLLEAVAKLGEPAAKARRRTVESATHYLATASDGLLAVARQDLDALAGWRQAVEQGSRAFVDRYTREYLTSEKFHRFDDSLARLLDLLDLPGAGGYLSGLFWLARTPYRLLRTLIAKALTRPEGVQLAEEPVLEGALDGWLDQLRAEALRRVDSHPLWTHVVKGFEVGLADLAREQFRQQFRGFQTTLADEVDRTSRSVSADLEKRPLLLNLMRAGKFLLDAAAVAGVLWAVGFTWYAAALVPVAVAATHQLVELLAKSYIDRQREETRRRQQALVAKALAAPLAEWLSCWPATGGSAYERLQLALHRIPRTVRQLEAAVAQQTQTRTAAEAPPAA